jgi:hypothetical protein
MYAGWFNPATAFCSQARDQIRAGVPLWTLRTKHEEVILKGNDGIDMLGADMFTVKDRRGYAPGQWTYAAQGPTHSDMAILGAGDDGPIGSQRFEAMREGIQLCEAMVFIQKAIEGKKLSGDLADKANKALDDRARVMTAHTVWPVKKEWWNGPALNLESYAREAFQRDSELYAMAAEVGKATAGK